MSDSKKSWDCDMPDFDEGDFTDYLNDALSSFFVSSEYRNMRKKITDLYETHPAIEALAEAELDAENFSVSLTAEDIQAIREIESIQSDIEVSVRKEAFRKGYQEAEQRIRAECCDILQRIKNVCGQNES